jgi:hypothetical protein
MPLKRAEDGWRWDKEASEASARWTSKARRQHIIETAEAIIDAGRTMHVWDALDTEDRHGLTVAEQRKIACTALRKEAEIGRMHETRARVLIRLLGGGKRLHTENKHPEVRRAARALLETQPELSDRDIATMTGLHRAIVAKIRAEVGATHQ